MIVRQTDVESREHMLRLIFPNRSVGAEIGVFAAQFSLRIIEILGPRILYLVDYWKNVDGLPTRSTYEHHTNRCRTALERVTPEIASGRVRVLCGLSVEMAKLVEDEWLDWVYIDAHHEKSQVLADLEAWYPKVKEGGIVSGHDYVPGEDWTGVPRALRVFSEGHPFHELSLTQPVYRENGRWQEYPSWWFRKP